jgi:RNA polymerase I-specific transcription initiation factor RRN3
MHIPGARTVADIEEPVIPSSSSSPVSRRIFHARHHLLLAHLLSLVPTLPSILHPLIAKAFPNKRESEVAQTTWVRNICELIGYCPELVQRLWGEIIGRMLRIDVSRSFHLVSHVTDRV